MRGNLDALAFDADDTLWHNERHFRLTQDRFAAVLSDFGDRASLDARLQAAERRNLGRYGFGIKGFMLSMIEAAHEVTGGQTPGEVIGEILEAGREMLAHPIELFPGVEEVITKLAGTHRLVLVTKGDLLDQERKLAQSGLGEFFEAVEIVSDKTPTVYGDICRRLSIAPRRLLMTGNSMKSDVLPPLEIGAYAAHIPADLSWDFEHAETPDHPRFHALKRIAEVPDLLAALD